MKILGIETSCDETAASVVEDGKRILSNVVISQVDIFSAYGGVIPEVAARSHLEAILPVIDKSLEDANLTWDDIDAIAVTHTPGLLGSLLIGTLTARTLAILHKKPLYPVHHLKSHIYANWLEKTESTPSSAISFSEHVSNPLIQQHFPHPSKNVAGASRTAFARIERNMLWNLQGVQKPAKKKTISEDSRENMVGKDKNEPSFPLLALVISGGHTQILYMKRHNHFEIIGTTHDDAVGECFDKVAKILGLPYPGGPSISKTAKTGDEKKYKLPHPKVENLDFSFSGLKTAVLRTVQKELGLPISHPSHDLKNYLKDQQIADFSASFEKTAVDILLEKLSLALEQHPDVKSAVFAGGVSANQKLRKESEKLNGAEISFPEPSLSGDNGAMVASACFYEIESGVKPTNPYSLNILPRSEIK